MLVVGIPVYNSRATIRDILNSLCAQTRKNFITIICDDCSTEPCDDIIEEYRSRLKIKYIKNEVNSGPGVSRQHILNTVYDMKPMPDYIMFADADDMYYPRAIDLLYTEAKKNYADIVDGEIFCEAETQDGNIIPNGMNLTWVFGKCYRTEYLRDNNISFLPNLRLNEDSYWNLVAHLSTDKKFQIDEPVYLWRNNKNSLTRSEEESFSDKYVDMYLYSQVEAAKRICTTKYGVKLGATLCNIYKAYEVSYLLKPEKLEEINRLVDSLFCIEEFYNLFKDTSFILNIVNSLCQAEIRNGNDVVFFPHSFNSWCSFFGVNLGISKIKKEEDK